MRLERILEEVSQRRVKGESSDDVATLIVGYSQ